MIEYTFLLHFLKKSFSVLFLWNNVMQNLMRLVLLWGEIIKINAPPPYVIEL